MADGPYTYELYAHPKDSELAEIFGRSVVAARIEPPVQLTDDLISQFTTNDTEIIHYATTLSASVYNIYVSSASHSHGQRVAYAAELVSTIVNRLNAIEMNDAGVWEEQHLEKVSLDESNVGTN